MYDDATLGATSLPSEEGSKIIFIFRQEPYKAYPRGPTHDLARTLLPLDLRGYHLIFQGALAHQ